MLNALVTIPLQIVCQLVVPGNDRPGNVPFDTQLPESTTAFSESDIKMQKEATTLTPYPQKMGKPVMVLPYGYTAFPDVGTAYKYFSNTVTWDSARKTCIENGSTLAEIDTFEKIKYAMTIKEWNRNLHVGIHRFFNSAEWTSLKTGLSLPMMPWATESNVGKMDHQCVRMFADGTGLTANECTSHLHFICEILLPMD